MFNRLIKSVYILLLVFSSLCMKANATQASNLIETTGTAELKVKPNTAKIFITIESNQNIKDVAKKMVDQIVIDMQQKLKELGVNKNQVQPLSFSLLPQYDLQKDNTKKFSGYVAKRSYQINLDNLNLVNQVMDSLVSSKDIQINRLDYDVLKPEIYKRKVQKLAVKNAITNATNISTDFGYKLGSIKSIKYNVNNFYKTSSDLNLVQYAGRASNRDINLSYIPNYIIFKDSVSVIYNIIK